MRPFKFICSATIFTFINISPTFAAGNVQTAALVGKACVNYLTGNGSKNTFLEQQGFKKRTNSYVRKSTQFGNSLVTGRDDRAKFYTTRDGCTYRYGSDKNARNAFASFSNAFSSAGFKSILIKSGRDTVQAYQVGDTIYEIHGYSRYQNSSYSTSIYTKIYKQKR